MRNARATQRMARDTRLRARRGSRPVHPLRMSATVAAACALTLLAGAGWATETQSPSSDGFVLEAPTDLPSTDVIGVDPEPVEPPDPVPTQPPVSVAAATAAGRTPGSFGVTSSGAATYRIPIWTPPGVGSVGLDLALVYSSRAGNGVLGQGWALSGLSVITRCNRTIAQDGAPSAVGNTFADRYCLDGRQLKLVSGSYGAPDSVYATEVESFSKIVASGIAGNGPASFTVTSKNGLVYEFGTTPDSQVYAGSSGTVRTWALSSIRDRAATTSGNSIAISYANDARNGAYTNGTIRVSSITYPVTATGQGPFYRVSFAYSARPANDVVAGYLAGSVVRETNQLDTITVASVSSGATIKSYRLSYAQGSATGRLQLRSVQECSPTSCLAPTVVTYQQGATGWASTAASTGSVASASAATRAVDLNGDGLSDLLLPRAVSSGGLRWWVALARPGGYASPVDTGVTSTVAARVITGRFLGNGSTQVLVEQGGSWVLVAWEGTTIRLTPVAIVPDGEYLAADVDGDGLDDLLSHVSSSPATLQGRRNTTVPGVGVSATFAASRVTLWTVSGGYVNPRSYNNVADINGDGRADIAVHMVATVKGGASRLTPLLSNGFDAPFTEGAQRDFWPDGRIVIVDWNGDGCSDFLQVSSVLVSSCDGNFTEIPTGAVGIARDASGNATVLPADWDGDGRIDLLYVKSSGSSWFGNTWYVVRSTGIGAATPAAIGMPAPDKSAWFVVDADGDGRTDLAWRDDARGGAIKYHLHNAPGVPADLAISFSDGFGMSQGAAYVSIASGSYTKHADAAFPEVDYAGPLYVVSQVAASDGTGGTYQNLFQYYGARVHLQGRGFEGFASRRSYDSRSGLYTYDYFERAFPYTGLHTRRVVLQSNLASKLSEWSATPGRQSLGAGFEQREFPHLASAVETRYEAGGALDGQVVTQATETYAYGDGYGNRTQVQRVVTDKDPASPFSGSSWQSNAVTTFANDATSNCLGLPVSSIVARTVPGQPSQARTVAYSVDTGACRISQQVLEPATPSLRVTTTLAFDGCGNVSSVQVVGSTQAGAAMPSRTTSLDYGARCQLPEKLTNALGQATRVSYQYDLGVPVSVTDPNGITTTWQYDDFGRRVLETRPDQTTTSWAFESCSTGPCWGQGDLRFHVYETSKGSAGEVYDQREQFFDGFDRPRSSQYMRVLGAWVTETWKYDSLGRPVTRYRPTSGPANGYVGWTYDVLDRVIARKLYQSNGAVDRASSFAYSGRTIRATDPLGRTRARVVDVEGRLRRVVDPSPGGTTSYDYDAFGNLIRVQDPIGAVSTGSYNLRGFRTQWSDADRGTWAFFGDSLNELVGWTDARGQSFSIVRDALGRPVARTEPDGTSTWTWGASAAAHSIGRLQSAAGYGYAENLAYDGAGRVASRTIVTDQSYQYDYAYNSIGTLDTLTYPSSPTPAGQSGARFKIQYAYSYGEPVQVTDVTDTPTSARMLWALNQANDDSRPTLETLGAGLLTVASGYKAWTGEIVSRQTGVLPATGNRQNLAYQWDTAGNLTQRQDVNQGLTETFTVDALDRVQSSTLNGIANLAATYDASGNITSRSDVGDYTYGSAAHPHAVTAAGSHTYTYDANGNQVTRDGASQAWASFNLPVQLAQPIDGVTYQSQFSYGPDHQRWKQVASYANGTETTFYVGGLLERESTTSTGRTYWRHYVYTPSGMAIVVSRNSDGTGSTSYALADHLGGTDAVLDASGGVTARTSFDAFGRRRGGDWSSGTTPDWAGIANSTRHGYTGHEHLDNVALIHMNGRVYDPGTGRFLSVDPVIGDLGDSQTVNPYAYAGNRPLVLTDPSGLDPTGGILTVSVVGSVIKTVGDLLFGGGDRYVPPASAMPGQSAQTTGCICGPGQSTVACGGWVLSVDPGEAQPETPYSPVRAVALDIIVSFIPYVGSAKGAYDAYDVLFAPDSSDLDRLVAVIGVLPAGKLAKDGRALFKAAQDAGRLSNRSIAGVKAAKVADVAAELPTPAAGQKVYRVYGGDSKAGGASWSPVRPDEVPNYRGAAGLPSGGASGATNTGQFVIEGTLMDPAKVVRSRTAVPLDRHEGGLPEYVIPGWQQNGAVRVDRVTGANPEF